MQSINGNRHDLDQGTNRGSRHWITTLPASLLTLLLVILMAFGPNLRPADAQSAGPTPTPTVDPTPTPPVDPTPTPTPTPGSQIIVGDITIGGTITIITGNLTLDQGTLPPIAGTIGGCAVYALTLANGSTAYPLVDSSCVPNGTTFVPVGGSDGGGIIIGSCSPTPTRVVQDCDLAIVGNAVLQDPAIDSLIKLHALPPADEARLLNWERSMVRATMFDRLLAIIALAPSARTTAEQAVVDAFAARLKQQRLAAATFARSEYYRWASNPCMYVPPAPFTYNRPTCSQLGNLFGTGSPPSFEEFQSYGVNEVYKKFSNDATLQRVAGETARDVGVLAGFVATGIAAAVGYTVGASLLAGGAIMAAIHPWLVASLATAAGVTKASLISTGVAAGVTGATSIAAVAAVVVLAVVIGVVQGIAVFNAAAIPGKLDAAVTVAQATPDLKQVISTDAGKQELFALFVAATMPDYAPTGSVPAAEVGDPQFWVTPASGSPSVSTEILYDDWKGNDRRVRMSGGWFVDNLGGTSELTLSIDYIDWQGNGWTAARTGDTFLHTRTGGAAGVASFLSAEIKYQTPAGQNYTALLVYPNIAPSFTKGANVTVNEDSGAYSATWGTSISAGPVRESAQTVSFTVANDNSALFSQQPAVSSGGTLSFTPATNANGSATVSVTAKDSGGTAYGGDDTSDAHTFTLTVNAVNDAPAFTAGPNVTVAEDSGASSTAWATAISAGPADESGQRLDFLVSTDNAALFSAQPLLGTDGMLSFTPATNANGSATVSVTAKDRGGTAHGGDDTSDAQTFTLTVNAVNDAPAVPANAPTISVVEDTPRSFVLGADLGVNDTADTSGPVAAGAANFPPVASLATVTAPDNGGLSYATTTGTLTFTPTADANGADSFRYRVCDQGTPASACTEQTVNVSITSVNDAPSFTKGADQIVVLNAGAQSVSGWATAISAGPANESAQALSFTLTNDNSALFSQQPALAPNGTLTFTPAAGTVGSALVTVVQKDDGGTALGGNDTSAPQTFRITVRYNVGDFAPPVDLPPTINTVTAGRTIPIKWRLTDASGAPVTGLSSVTITAPVVSGSTGSATDEIEVYVDGSAGLKNLGDGNYQYNWSVPKSYAGSVRMLLLDLGEGPAVEHPALFQFK